ncbi:hypothetical protein MLD38_028068 [Melastoma candidum]|uniref:Uncharacterized protein n=1 Tax=Melastoma candidum TaxID=119954 RepID=A0ACB9N0S2_9MYRT|nr:hypothetical protein MLD38_028068 [Melastoma candidum]
MGKGKGKGKDMEIKDGVVKVRGDKIASFLTCPLCHKLLREATTISECLHSFCRKCIYEKIQEEELHYCPVCDIHLGSVPLEKLRPDHNLQDVRSRIFPVNGKKVDSPEDQTPVTLPSRRKEKSLSQLVVNAPTVLPSTALTGKRTKAVRKVHASPGSAEKPAAREESSEDCPEKSSSPETIEKFAQTIRKGFTSAEPIKSLARASGKETSGGKLDLWKPLNCLLEAANRTKSFKPGQKGADDGDMISNGADLSCNGANGSNSRMKPHSDHALTEVSKPRRFRKVCRKEEAASADYGISPQTLVDATTVKYDARTCSIWFALVASEEQEGDAPLPQIPSRYLRVQDGNMPVSCIQKYLKSKLQLRSETEVEIRYMGQTLPPSLQLCSVVEFWLQAASPEERVPAVVGLPAKDFVMVLGYARKIAKQS